MMISIPKARAVLEALQTLVADPQIDFGPAYEGAKLRQQDAIYTMQRYIDDANKILLTNGMEPV